MERDVESQARTWQSSELVMTVGRREWKERQGLRMSIGGAGSEDL